MIILVNGHSTSIESTDDRITEGWLDREKAELVNSNQELGAL